MASVAFHAIGVGKADARVEIRLEGGTPTANPLNVDLATASFELDGKPSNLKEMVDAWVDRAKHARCDHFPSAGAAAGIRVLDFSEERTFEPGQAIGNGNPVTNMNLAGTVEVEISEAMVVSAFEVESRGRVVTVQVGSSAVQITASIVQLLNPSGPAGEL